MSRNYFLTNNKVLLYKSPQNVVLKFYKKMAKFWAP